MFNLVNTVIACSVNKLTSTGCVFWNNTASCRCSSMFSVKQLAKCMKSEASNCVNTGSHDNLFSQAMLSIELLVRSLSMRIDTNCEIISGSAQVWTVCFGFFNLYKLLSSYYKIFCFFRTFYVCVIYLHVLLIRSWCYIWVK